MYLCKDGLDGIVCMLMKDRFDLTKSGIPDKLFSRKDK